MKKTTIAATLTSLLLFQSCYKDLSTDASLEISPIQIEGIANSMTIAFGQTLSFTPTVTQEGRTEEDFDYLWEMDLTPQSMTGRMEIGTEKDLELRISNTPSDKPYTISFKATDRITGLSKTVGCKLYVGSSLGEGLLVAHTRDNGATSEFDLVSNEFLTWGYTDKVRYTRDLWSLTNENSFEGEVKAMIALCDTDGGVFNENKIMIGTDQHIMSVNPLTFKVKDVDGAN
ncbi:MAG: PKD-like family lipoprotein, partial [Candidatus Cryptobacteroides sp.]